MASAMPNWPSVSVNFQWALEKKISFFRLSCSCRVASSTWLPRIRFSVTIIWNSLRHLWRMSNSSLWEFTASFSFWTSFSKRSSWARPLLLILRGWGTRKKVRIKLISLIWEHVLCMTQRIGSKNCTAKPQCFQKIVDLPVIVLNGKNGLFLGSKLTHRLSYLCVQLHNGFTLIL